MLQRAEGALLTGKKAYVIEYFLAQGYEEPKTLETITRISNVTEAQKTRYFY